MKFTEALEKAYKNPGKVFERKCISGMMYMRFTAKSLQFKAPSSYGFIDQFVSSADIESDWQPVPKEVTWQEALEAWLTNNKKIKCILPDDKVDEYIRKETVISPSNNDLVRFRIYAKYAKFYILED